MPRWATDRPVDHGSWAGYRRCTLGAHGRACTECRAFVAADVARRRRERVQGVPAGQGGLVAAPVAHGSTLGEAKRCRQRPQGECPACRAVPRAESRRGGELCERCYRLLPRDGEHDCPEQIGYHGPACSVCLQWLPADGEHECPGPRCSACGQVLAASGHQCSVVAR